MHRPILFAMILALSACSGGDAEDVLEESDAPGDTDRVATTIVSSGTPNNCSFTWDGQPITQEGIIARAVVVMDDTISAAGGVENIMEEDLPVIRFEAESDAPFHCMSLAVGVVRAAGFAGGALRIAGTEQDVDVLFEITGMESSSPLTIASLDDSGAISISGRPVALANLGSEIVPQPGLGPIAGAGTLFLLPSANTAFSHVFEAAEAITQSGGRATLASCYSAALDSSFAADEVGTPLPIC